MNFDYLNTFHEVVQKKSFTGAAKELKKAKSAISRQVGLLEQYFGEPLINRERKDFTLTTKGEIVFERAKKIIAEFKTLYSAKEQISCARLKISSTDALLSTWLSTFLHKFYEENPLWEFELFSTIDEIDTALKHSDICIRPQCPPSNNYTQFFLRKWLLQLYASEEYLEKNGFPKTIDDLTKHKILIFTEKNQLYSREYVNWPLFKGTKFNQPRKSVIETNSLHSMHNMVSNGIGIGAFAIDSPFHQHKKLVPILPGELSQEIEVYLIIPNSLLSDERIIVFKKFLNDILTK